MRPMTLATFRERLFKIFRRPVCEQMGGVNDPTSNEGMIIKLWQDFTISVKTRSIKKKSHPIRKMKKKSGYDLQKLANRQ